MNIEVTGCITVLRDIKTVFDFIANLENDKLWRKEINSTIMTAKPQVNVQAIENSYLSKRTPNHSLNLICTAYLGNKQIVYETLPDSNFFLKSDRQVEAISQNETRILYGITFDKKIVKHGLGFNLPAFIIYLVAKADMKKYLTKLKTIVEMNNA